MTDHKVCAKQHQSNAEKEEDKGKACVSLLGQL